MPRPPVISIAMWTLVPAAMILSACGASSGYKENTYPVARGHFDKAVALGSGTIGGSTWTLNAEQDGNGELCLAVAWQPRSPLSPYGFACGFGSNTVDDGGRGREPTNRSQASGGQVIAYGPSPAGATRVVLSMPTIAGTNCNASAMSPTTVTITHRIPAWYPLKGTGWFVASVPNEAFSCVINAVFFDARGREVKQPNNF